MEAPRTLGLSRAERIQNGLSYNDTSRMQLQRRTVVSAGRLPVPAWTNSDAGLRAVLVRTLELRGGLFIPQAGTELQRLRRAHLKLKSRRRNMEEILTRLCREFAELRRRADLAPADIERLRRLQGAIIGLDRELMIVDKLPAIIVGAVYGYWRRGEDCVAVGNSLGLSPQGTRKLLWKLRQVGDRLDDGLPPRPRVREEMAIGTTAPSPA